MCWGIARFVGFQRVYEGQQYMTASIRPHDFTMGQQTPHRRHTGLEWATIILGRPGLNLCPSSAKAHISNSRRATV